MTEGCVLRNKCRSYPKRCATCAWCYDEDKEEDFYIPKAYYGEKDE